MEVLSLQLFSTVQNRPHRAARSGFAGFVVVWLNFALQPCAMALDGTHEHDCPHCPPVHTSQHGSHESSAHSSAHSPIHSSTHSSAMNEAPCGTGADDCSLIDDLKYDGRVAELKLKDAPSDVPLAIHPTVLQFAPARSAAEVGWYPTRSPPPGKRTPLSILYCVFLD